MTGKVLWRNASATQKKQGGANNRNLASMESSLTLENRESMQSQQSIKKKSMRKVSTT